MTLLDTCEPLFQRICSLNRTGREGGGNTPDLTSLRREINELMNKARDAMLAEPSLERHWDKLEMPLIFFADSMISESKLPVATDWNKNRIAYDYKELAGDQKFFDLLDGELADQSNDATQRLGVYYTCIGLGFTGWYGDNAEPLRSRMVEMIRRIDPGVRTEGHLKICPEAYDNVDTRDLIEPPPISAKILFGFFLALLLIFIAVNLFLYQEATSELREDLAFILSKTLEQTQLTLRSLL